MPKKILVVNGDSYANALKGLGAFTNKVQNFLSNPKDYDLVLFTGGEDVSPELYNDTSPDRVCHSNMLRDAFEKEVFNTALEHGIKMTGICRGSQFINVMSGGRMMHDIGSHAGPRHEMCSFASEPVIVNSYHHQMSVVGNGGHIIAWSRHRLSNRYIGRDDKPEEYKGLEVEGIYYPETKCAGVQWHPEMMQDNEPGYIWYLQMVDDFLNCSQKAFEEKYVGVHNKSLEV